MFSKSETGTTPPAGAPEIHPTRLAQDLKITGNLKAAGSVEVLGVVEGDIEAGKLIIGAEGRVNGKVRAEIVDVMGKIDGSISCRNLTLRSSAGARVQVSYESLTIESGADVEGKFKQAKSR
ncbi:hypothetical protein U879_06535 [Defluviimonas sp. 20V17]|uniref:Polymer-forming protein n=1 Tax=Allgaiera indica TaxID=765699 RepID=A0AAN5A187_9RHOB|nr:polymer-forming cytoskeletal protein [Allgaiera indica]KDB04474.1 hypothetical protein U879_06535 [Defluviimonas sp. 20V17]GHE06140.1 hypothetical protein GCM10008024_39570 [Allgaiera indica]SDX86522.1 Polymer-forming protein [Allgaiera indica]